MSITNDTKLIEIIKAFPEFGKYIGFLPVNNGHINDTFVIEYEDENGKTLQYLLQRINTNVFKKPVELMENIIGVTEFLKKKIISFKKQITDIYIIDYGCGMDVKTIQNC